MPPATDLRQKATSLRGRLPERRQSQPPQENGRRLASIRRGPDEELRVHWSEYQRRPFLSLRIWTRDPQGGWWPDGKRGVAIRIRELADLAEAIAEALELADEHVARQPRQPARGEAPRDRADGSGGAPRPSQGGTCGRPDGFDEFEGA
jgi:hypothetical protein